jgi:hypothetical protein
MGVHRQELENTYEGGTLSDFLYRDVRPGRGWIQVTMMDGFTITFEAGSVALELRYRGSWPRRNRPHLPGPPTG